MENVIISIILILGVILAIVFGISGAQTEWIIIGLVVIAAIIFGVTKKKKG